MNNWPTLYMTKGLTHAIATCIRENTLTDFVAMPDQGDGYFVVSMNDGRIWPFAHDGSRGDRLDDADLDLVRETMQGTYSLFDIEFREADSTPERTR